MTAVVHYERGGLCQQPLAGMAFSTTPCVAVIAFRIRNLESRCRVMYIFPIILGFCFIFPNRPLMRIWNSLMASPSKILVTAPFHHLESSLASRVRGLGDGDPLAHRRVVVISNRLRDHVHGVLARAGGFAGVEVLSMIDLARKVCRAGARPGGILKHPHPGSRRNPGGRGAQKRAGGVRLFRIRYERIRREPLRDADGPGRGEPLARSLAGAFRGNSRSRCGAPPRSGASGRAFPWLYARARVLRPLLAFPGGVRAGGGRAAARSHYSLRLRRDERAPAQAGGGRLPRGALPGPRARAAGRARVRPRGVFNRVVRAAGFSKRRNRADRAQAALESGGGALLAR